MLALWIVVVLVGWIFVAAVVGAVLGRSIRLADQRELSAGRHYLIEAAENPNFAL